MKNFLLATALLISFGLSAQVSFGYYGLHNMKNDIRHGWGFGMNGLSSPIVKDIPIKMQAGLGYHMLWAGQKNFEGMVLADGEAPRDIAFTNMQMSLHGIFRISVPSINERFSPYAEVSPGIGFTTSVVDIHDENETSNCSSVNANQRTGFSLTGATGMLIKLNDAVSIDAGMTWETNTNRGNMIMMNSINLSDGVSYGMKAAPSTVVCFRIGVRFSVTNSGCCDFSGCTIKRHHTDCGHTELPHR